MNMYLEALRSPCRLRVAAIVGLTLGLVTGSVTADVIYTEEFSNGLGRFTATGSVYTGTYGARMRGGSTPGVITTNAIDTSGFESLTLSATRTASGLDLGEAGRVSVSVNGGAFTVLESQRSPTGRVTFQLGNAASVRLRFSITASSFLEMYDVDAIALEGTPVGGCEPNCPPPPTGTDPGTGPWTLIPSANVATECRLDPALLQQANRTLGLAWAVVRYGKLCHEYYPSGRDPADQVYSTTKTMGALTIGALIHQSRAFTPTTTRKRGPLGEFQRVDHWLDSFTFNRDSTTAHVLAMTAAASTSLAWGQKEWRYDTVGSEAINRLSDVTNTVIAQDPTRLGSNIGQFWRRHFAQPLDLESSTWGSSDTSKNFATSWNTTIRDMARVGLLMLNGGVWDGQRLVDENYLYNLMHPAFEDANTGYGYLTWLNEDDSCAPKPIHRSYPHGLSQATSCMRAEGCSQTYDVGVSYAAGAGGQYIVVHRGLDLVIVVKDSGGQSGNEPARFWRVLRPALLALDPTFRNNEAGFCAAYGQGEYAPDLKVWGSGR
ncbi:MAG TPA: serine hydrolase [Steroidobacteraceae bacterium]|nr:serine hydrolase [Steroidobacteraceae bacterium]